MSRLSLDMTKWAPQRRKNGRVVFAASNSSHKNKIASDSTTGGLQASGSCGPSLGDGRDLSSGSAFHFNTRFFFDRLY